MENYNYFTIISYVFIQIFTYNVRNLLLLFDHLYIFAHQNWLRKVLNLVYSLFVYCMNIVTAMLAYGCDLENIANAEFYKN